jgi:hypothetical protein
MAATPGPVEAAATLQDYFGPRLDASHDEGRDLMIDALRKQFGISKRDARALVDELEKARTIRFRPGSLPVPIPGASPTATTSTLLPLGTVSGAGGYWQLEAPPG